MLCRLMLKHGACTWSSLNSDDSPGKLPLTFALENGDMGMARLLLQTKLLLDKKDAQNLLNGIQDASLEVLNALFSCPTRLSTAEVSGMLSLLTQTGLSPSAKEGGRNTLMLACHHGNAAAVQALTGAYIWQSYMQVQLICPMCSLSDGLQCMSDLHIGQGQRKKEKRSQKAFKSIAYCILSTFSGSNPVLLNVLGISINYSRRTACRMQDSPEADAVMGSRWLLLCSLTPCAHHVFLRVWQALKAALPDLDPFCALDTSESQEILDQSCE